MQSWQNLPNYYKILRRTYMILSTCLEFQGFFLKNPLKILQIPGIFCNIENAILTQSPELLQNPGKNLHDVVDMLRIPRVFFSKIPKNPTNSRDFCNIQNAILTESPDLLQNPGRTYMICRHAWNSQRVFSKIHKNPANSRDCLQHPKCNLDKIPRITVKSKEELTWFVDMLRIPRFFSQKSLKILQVPGIFCNIQNAILTESPELLRNPRTNWIPAFFSKFQGFFAELNRKSWQNPWSATNSWENLVWCTLNPGSS